MSERIVTYDEFADHNKRENLWILVHGKVYDVAKFLDEHPGGEEVIFAEAGKDATESFEDVGHSDDARDQLKDLLVGIFDGGDKLKAAPVPTAGSQAKVNVQNDAGPSAVTFLVPVIAAGAYFAWRYLG